MKLGIASPLLTLVLLAAPLAAEAQQVGKAYHRIALVNSGAPANVGDSKVGGAFRQGLREFGYVEGQNITIEYRGAELKAERFPGIMAELVHLGVDVIALPCGSALDAARQATSTIPLVVVACNVDLLRSGIIASLARPGGNITGMSKLSPELAQKRLELLKEVVPKASRVAVLWNPSVSEFATDWEELQAAARQLGATLQSMEFRTPDDFGRAFVAMTKEHAEAFTTFSDPAIFFSPDRVVSLAAKHRLPAIYPFREGPAAGGLMSYGADILDLVRRSAHYVAKILKGAKPADLPVEQPTKFELVINMKTAKALGLTIPQSVLMRADEIIQ
jgi:putative ABC transport system substrate-binding protein